MTAPSPVPSTLLRAALLHLAPRPWEPEANRAALLAAVEAAADRGARLILAPELAVSGYSMRNRDEAARLAEGPQDETLQALAALCRRRGLHVALGLLERDPRTGLLHNTAFLMGPEGRLLGRHRKLTASERRWATPGRPTPASVVDTPWGRLGLLVCADTYFALPCRTQALQGADLFVVVANWPPAGIDPRRAWRARALENGVGMLVCNRTGVDQHLDCREARSYAVGPRGEVLLDGVSPEPTCFVVDLPLVEGRLPRHPAALEGRCPGHWSALGLDGLNLGDTSYLWGPAPEDPVSLLLHPDVQHLRHGAGLRVAALPEGEASRRALETLASTEDPWPGDLVLAGDDGAGPFLADADGIHRAGDRDHLFRVCGALRLGVARPGALRHPEPAVALAKEGCDLLVLSGSSISGDLQDLLAVRCLERVPVVLALDGEAWRFLPPDGHGPWEECRVEQPTVLPLDVAARRRRAVFDRLDLDTLLAGADPTDR